MKSLPWGLMAIIFLPLLFFVGGSLSLILSFSVLLSKREIGLAGSRSNTSPAVYKLFSAPPPILGVMTSSAVTADARAVTLEQFFARYRSPLVEYSQQFVEISDRYSIPWQVLPAISMQESTGGKNVPEDCYNPFGWGIHARGTLCFASWEEGIENVAKGFKEKYIDNGLVTIDQIMRKYNPISYNRDGSWANGVQFFLNELESFNSP